MLLYDLTEKPATIPTESLEATVLTFPELRDALAFGSLEEGTFCALWRKAAALAYQRGNLIALRLLVALLVKAPARSTNRGQLLYHQYSGVLMLFEGAFDKAAYHFGLQYELAQLLNDPTEVVLALFNLSRVGFYELKLNQVEDWLQKAERLAEISRNPELIVKTLNRQAELASYRHLTDQSITLASRALRLARSERLPLEEAYALNWLGLNYIYRREWDKAEAALQEALNLRQKARDVLGRAWTLANLSRLYLKQGAVVMAESAIEGSLVILQQLKNRPGLAQALYHKALIFFRSDQTAAALPWAMEAVEIRLEMGEPTRLAEAFSLLGQVYDRLGQTGYATLCHLRVLELQRPDDYIPQWIELLTEASNYLLHRQPDEAEKGPSPYWPQALAGYRNAIKIIEQNGELYYLAPTLGRMARALLKIEGMEGLREAERCYRLQLNLLGDIESPFFEPSDAIAQRAEALNGILICSSLLRRHSA